jgi:hypothetical protein
MIPIGQADFSITIFLGRADSPGVRTWIAPPLGGSQ